MVYPNSINRKAIYSNLLNRVQKCMKCDLTVHSYKCFSPNCYRATIEFDICQQSVVLLGGNIGTRCYIAVNRVSISADSMPPFGRQKVDFLTELATTLALKESASVTHLRTLVM